ncbi:MAG: O-antigen ligase family protein [Bryobacterales bacterium]|nr:O-antigen ligase family protein [Bryobacterales bacterium]
MFTTADGKLNWHAAALYFAMAAGVSGLLSTALLNIILGFTIVTLVADRKQFRLPPIWAPFAVFVLWTLLSAAASDKPLMAWPQIKKFYVWVVIFAIYALFRKLADIRRLLLAIVLAGTASALFSYWEFFVRYQRAQQSHQPFYNSYVADRITGFMSHWMTFSAQMMICLLILAAWLFFARERRHIGWWIVAGAIMALGLLLAMTRSVWPATGAGLVYLMWFWRRWTVALLPALALLVVVAAPEPIATRIRSIYRPDRTLDSNQHREVLRETGLRMMEAHPLLGVGPERVYDNFEQYYPPDAPHPIPSNWYYRHLHNTYIHYAAERGIPAMLAILALFAKCLYDFFRALRRPLTPDQRFAVHAAVAVVIGVAIGGWWEVNLGDSEVLSTFLAVVGSGYAALKQEQEPTLQA